jgi:hypothetical protein
LSEYTASEIPLMEEKREDERLEKELEIAERNKNIK